MSQNSNFGMIGEVTFVLPSLQQERDPVSPNVSGTQSLYRIGWQAQIRYSVRVALNTVRRSRNARIRSLVNGYLTVIDPGKRAPRSLGCATVFKCNSPLAWNPAKVDRT